jgi:hypothetical protein
MKRIITDTRDVIVCDGCGKGFLTYPRQGVDIEPLWRWAGMNLEGGICGGALLVINRGAAIRIAEQFKPLGETNNGS